MEEKMCCTCKHSDFQTGDLVTFGYSRDVYVYLCDNLVIHVPADVTIDYATWPSTHRHGITAGIDILKANTNDFIILTSAVQMDRVEYATITEIIDHNATARKDCRVLLSDWIQKRKVNDMEEIKLCRTCKYKFARCNEEPCLSCRCKSNWLDASKPKKFKAGDLVIAKNSYKETKILYIYLCNKWVLRVPYFVTVGSNAIMCCSKRCFSNYTDKLIANGTAAWIDDLEYASPEIIEKHDKSARMIFEYKRETLNEWFSKLIGKEPEKKTESKVFTTPNMIKNVIFSDPATIIFWEDGTKTVVKTQDGEEYDKEKGLAMAVCKKVFGNERDYYNIFKRWMRKGEERHEET